MVDEDSDLDSDAEINLDFNTENRVVYNVPIVSEFLLKLCDGAPLIEDKNSLEYQILSEEQKENILKIMFFHQRIDGSFANFYESDEEKIIISTALSIISLFFVDSEKYEKNIVKSIDYLTEYLYNNNQQLPHEIIYVFETSIDKCISTGERYEKITKIIEKCENKNFKIQDLIKNFESSVVLFDNLKESNNICDSASKLLILSHVKERFI